MLVPALIVASAVVATAIVGRWALQRRVARRRVLRGPRAVQEASAWTIGSIPQWVQIRGHDDQNPLLIYLHGGPGFPMLPFSHVLQDAWERDVTVVQWDQRNAGRTLRINGIMDDDLTLDRHVEDGLELAQRLRGRFPGRPIILLGHSWGTAIAVEMLRREPDGFAGYLATGQISDFLGAERYGYETTRAAAADRGDARTQRALERHSGYPWGENLTPDAITTVRAAEAKLGYFHHTDPRFMLRLLVLAFRSPDYTWRDLLTLTNKRAQAASLKLALRELPAFSGRAAGATLSCPVVMLGGEFDLYTPTPFARAFFDTLSAPAKEFVDVPGTAHVVPLEDPELFRAILRDRLLPLLTAPRS